MPKAGTNLLIRLLDLLPGMEQGPHIDIGPDEGLLEFGEVERSRMAVFLRQIRPGIFGSSHCYYSDVLADMLRSSNVRCITIVRDPRDVCVSDYHYIIKSPSHRLHDAYQQMTSDASRLMASITGLSSDQLNGAPPSLDIGMHYEQFIGWASYADAVTVRFEDLIGARGGGNDQCQRETVRKIMVYLDVDLSDAQLDNIIGRLFSQQARTFRRGQIGDWRYEFDAEHHVAFERVAGHVLDAFGYEG
jgi:hypothetical protein